MKAHRRRRGADTAPEPTVASLSPTLGPPAGGTLVTIQGTGFVSPGGQYSVAYVTFGTTHATGVTVSSATSLTCTAPALPVGPVDVRVWGTGGLGLLPFAYVSGGLTTESGLQLTTEGLAPLTTES